MGARLAVRTIRSLLGDLWRWRLVAWLLASAIGIVGIANQDRMGPLTELEGASLDWRFRLRGAVTPPSEIQLLVIDDEAIRSFGGWPVPREILAKLVTILNEVGAVIAFDVLLTDVKTTPDGRLAPGDESLIRALQDADAVVLPMALGFIPGILGDTTIPKSIRRHAYRLILQSDGQVPLPRAHQAVLPATTVLGLDIGIGHAGLELAPDGTLRADLPAIRFGGEVYPSFSVAAAARYLNLLPTEIVLEQDKGVWLGQELIPFDQNYRHYLNFYGGPDHFQRHGLRELLQLHIPRELFSNRLVIIGVDALGAGDRFATPYSASMAGIDIVATSIANMLDGRSLQRGRVQSLLDIVAVVMLAGLAALLSGRATTFASILPAFALLATLFIGCYAAFALGHWWLSFAYPATAVLVSTSITQVARSARNVREARSLERDRATLARHFAPAVVEELLTRDYRVQFNRLQENCILFVDLVGFTTVCETMRPSEAMAFLRQFHQLIETAIFSNHGMIANFAGDGVMCCFGVPDPSDRDAGNALIAAKSIVSAVHRWRATLAARKIPSFDVGVGVHWGPVLVGNVGGQRQLQYTVVGDTVNAASRLQANTRDLRVNLLVSDQVLSRAQAHPDADRAIASMVEIGQISLRGRKEPMVVWGWRLEPLPSAKHDSEV